MDSLITEIELLRKQLDQKTKEAHVLETSLKMIEEQRIILKMREK